MYNHIIPGIEKEIETLPGFLKNDIEPQLGNLEDFPAKFDYDLLHIDQERRVYPKNFIYRRLLARKMNCIVKKTPFLGS